MSDILLPILTEHGPWVLLVFYLLYRDVEKEKIARELIGRNTEILIELATIIRERLDRA